MGNEQSKSKESTKKGKIHEKRENGGVNGLSVTITSGMGTDVNSEATIQHNGKSAPIDPVTKNTAIDPITESNEPDYVVVDSADPPLSCEKPDGIIQMEEVEKSKEEKVHRFGKMFKKKEPAADVKSISKTEPQHEAQTDVSLPAADPQLESEAVTKVETSTQTDGKSEADISTQTGDDCDTAANGEGREEEAATTETEHSQSDPAVLAEVVSESANEEATDNQTAGFIVAEVVLMERVSYENTEFTAESMEVADVFEISQTENSSRKEEHLNGPGEPGITTEAECDPKEPIAEDEIGAEENKNEETPFELSTSLPKVVADCIKAVLTTASESTDDAAVNVSEPRAREVITEDNADAGGDISTDEVLIETVEPNAVTPEAGGAISIASLEEELVTEAIEVVSEEPANEDTHTEEQSVLPGTKMLDAADNAAALEKVREISEEANLSLDIAAESAEKCSEEETVTEGGNDGAPSKKTELIATEDACYWSDEVKIIPESIPEIIIRYEAAEADENGIPDVGCAETVEESKASPANVEEGAEEIPEEVIDALSQELDTITPQEPAADNESHMEEAVIVPTVFVPLSAVQEAGCAAREAVITSHNELVAEETQEEVTEVVHKDTTVQETTNLGEVTETQILEEALEESEIAERNSEVSEDALAQGESTETPEQGPEEPLRESAHLCKDAITQVLENIQESVAEEVCQGTGNAIEKSGDVQANEALTQVTKEESEEHEGTENYVGESGDVPADEALTHMTKEESEKLEGTENCVEESGDVPAEEALTEVTKEESEELEGTENCVEESGDVPAEEALTEVTKEESEELEGTETYVEESGDVPADEALTHVTKKESEKLEGTENCVEESGDVPAEEALTHMTKEESEKLEGTENCVEESGDAPAEEALTHMTKEESEKLEGTENCVEQSGDVPAEEALTHMTKEESEKLEGTENCVEQSGDVPAEEALTHMTKEESEKLEGTENCVEQSGDVPAAEAPADLTEESEHCNSVQEEKDEEMNAEVDLKGADKGAPSVVAEESLASSPVLCEEAAEESVNPLEHRPNSEVLVVIIETAEDEVIEEIFAESPSAVFEENKCPEAVVEEITTEDVEPDIITEQKGEAKEKSSVDTTTVSRAEGNINHREHMKTLVEEAKLKQEPETLTEPESVTADASPEGEKAETETDDANSQPVENPEESEPEENPVMNFFKTLVSPTKTSQKEKAKPDATKDQCPKETKPATTTTVAQVSDPPAPKGMSIPPPPPPEPPKMEVKGEPAAKPIKPTPKEEAKPSAKVAESQKGKSTKDTLSKFFRSKVLPGFKASKGKGASASGANAKAKTAAVETPVELPQSGAEVKSENEVEAQGTAEVMAQPLVEDQVDQQMALEIPQPVVDAEMAVETPPPVVDVEKVDPSKTGTLEAAAKPEPPPPVQEEKKPASKSPFFSLFKPKAGETKKATPAPAAAAAAAAAESAQTAKPKEEPKAAAKSAETAADSKTAPAASQAGDDAASGPRKLEKRNSIHLFFKYLGQKRNSTDAGVQTEPVTVAPAAEKTK